MKNSLALFAIASVLTTPLAIAQTDPANPASPSAGETSDRTPDAKTQTPLSQADPAGGKTSDRTPDASAGNAGSGASAGVAGKSDMKMTKADCDVMWKQADSSSSGSLSASQAQSYVGDFKAIDSDADGKLSSAEFLKGCESGSLKSGASTGANPGASGSSTSGSSSSTSDPALAPKK